MPKVSAIPRQFSTWEYRDALAEMVASAQPTFFVTLVFNQEISIDSAAAALRAFQARQDRKTLGPRWQRLSGRRSRYIAVIEHAETNLHIHAAFVVEPACRPGFVQNATTAWNELMLGGSVDVQAATYAVGVGRYMVKQITPATSELLLISEGF